MQLVRRNLPLYWLYIACIMFMLVLVLTSYTLNIPFSDFTRDPLAITGGHPFLGIVSNIGVVIWSFSIIVCLFSYAILSTNNRKDYDVQKFILFGGGLSFIFLIDDLFMLHVGIYPNYLGISQDQVVLIYGLFVLFYLLKFRKIILKTRYIFLELALLFFAISLFFDKQPQSLLTWHYLFEDGAKFFGIVSWFSYHFTHCFHQVTAMVQDH